MNDFLVSIALILGSILGLGLIVSPQSWLRGISQCFIYAFLYLFCTLPETYVLFIAVCLCLGMNWELARASSLSTGKTAIFAISASITCFLTGTDYPVYMLPVLGICLALLLLETRLEKHSKTAAASICILSILSLSSFYLIRITEQGIAWCLLILFLANIFDAFSMLIGKAIGKHSLAPKISPGKTWEGSIGGMIITAAISPYLCTQVGLQLSEVLLISSICVLCLLALCGDLLASILKRQQNLKDYSNIIPGHGGLLDRFDSYLLCIPSMFVLIQLYSQ